MPLISIRSLPFENEADMPAMIRGITEDFSHGSDVSIEHITVTWEFIPTRQYSVAGLMPSTQPQSGSHPVLVEFHVPDFHKRDVIEGMMESIAFSISKRSGVSFNNVFIHYHKVESGTIFDSGEIVRWK